MEMRSEDVHKLGRSFRSRDEAGGSVSRVLRLMYVDLTRQSVTAVKHVYIHIIYIYIGPPREPG